MSAHVEVTGNIVLEVLGHDVADLRRGEEGEERTLLVREFAPFDGGPAVGHGVCICVYVV